MDNAESEKDFNIKICDDVGHCCKTGNLRKPRENRKIDVYAQLLLLGTCAERVRQSFEFLAVQSSRYIPSLGFLFIDLIWTGATVKLQNNYMVFSFRASEHFKVFGWHSLFLSVVFCFLAIICVSVVDQFLVS